MVRITEDLIRKRAEHNESVIASLEEISLHQQDIEKIEYLDKWCRELKILYLQSNLIPKIENLSRLKKVEYINFALNNIEVVENLEGCESLNKLDFTVNFIGKLTSIECLKNLVHLRDLFLTGNPCAQFEGYRHYVLATLPQLQYLDGLEIEKSERILAIQALHEVRPLIIAQQASHEKKRDRERAEATTDVEQAGCDKKDGTDWYTDIESGNNEKDKENDTHNSENIVEKTNEQKDKEFWEEKVAFTPESRIKVHEYMQEQKCRDDKPEKQGPDVPKRERRLQDEDGRIYNVNESKVDFSLTEDHEQNCVLLDVAIYKYLDTSMCDVDVQPLYVRLTVKGKILQLVLPEEVKPDSSSAKRSQVTGHLLITMPKAKQFIKPNNVPQKPSVAEKPHQIRSGPNRETLEVDPKSRTCVDISKIIEEKSRNPTPLKGGKPNIRPKEERPNSADFVDDLDVPPLL